MKTVIVSKQNKAKHNPSYFQPFFFLKPKTAKHNNHRLQKKDITTAEPQNTQQRNRKSAHFYFACIVTSLGLNDETCMVK